ncbi:MAG: 3-keto-5-aminohexanoate cleavage protein [Rhodobiaceae bacterium]|nr:3-keto-5-aminohexanoate cleavage protein [Rhodobiaceae bacterium]MCC0056129.1 3-keto-5-aminohexanoate cleavage protein [Rhodobiaceae bacterium]
MKPIIIEARVNEYAMRTGNRHIPWTASELANAARECEGAGASVIHFHARDTDGAPAFGFEVYRAAIEAIRAASGLLVYPTLGADTAGAEASSRIAHIKALAGVGLAPDLAPIDMGSTNVDRLTPDGSWLETEGRVYLNSVPTLKFFAARFRELGVRPQLVHWNLPMLRMTRLFLENGLIDPVPYLLLGLSAKSLALHPPDLVGLAAYEGFLPSLGPTEWTVHCSGGDLLPLVPHIARQGGHISIGIGDYDYRELGEPTNASVVERAVAIARRYGREPATPEEARALLRIGN